MRRTLTCLLGALVLVACTKSDPISATDPFPMPSGMEKSKDLAVKPGDGFYDYCNGNWLKETPIPAARAVGGLYDQRAATEKLQEQLKAKNPEVGHFYELLNAASGNPEASKAYLDALKAQFPKPATKEEAFITLGKMMAEGVFPWDNSLVPTYNMEWVNGKLMGSITPIIDSVPPGFPDIPDIPGLLDSTKTFIPVTATRAGEAGSALSLILKGMGQDPSLFVTNPAWGPYWEKMEQKSLEDLQKLIDEAFAAYEKFGAEQLDDKVRNSATLSYAYILSYHFANEFLTAEFKARILRITEEIQAALRKRIQRLDWMSQTTKDNAVDKLDACGLYVVYPDQWYTDCIPNISECKTLTEAVHKGYRGISRLRSHLLGTTDVFSYLITKPTLGGPYTEMPADLTLGNAFYSGAHNGIFIYPAFMMPPMLPENVSEAYEFAIFAIIGHEFTHGFDASGAKQDKYGNDKNWWTVADQMSFEERSALYVDLHNHLQIDPVRRPGVCNDGKLTLDENIADLGGFLTALDAYQARLEADGFTGETLKDQLRKFYEAYAYMWRAQYSDATLAEYPKKDTHSLNRLRVDGVVMNTDLWYELYNVDRNNLLYLPKERRTYIW